MNIRYYRPETKSSKNTVIAKIITFVTFAAVTFPASLQKSSQRGESFLLKPFLSPFLSITFIITITFNIYIYKRGLAYMLKNNGYSLKKSEKKGIKIGVQKTPMLKNGENA